MTPTPPSNPSFQSHFRFRRLRNPDSYDQPRQAPSAHDPVTPLQDRGPGAGEGEGEGEELDPDDADVDVDGDVDIEDEEEGADEDDCSNIGDEGHEGEEGEGGIEEVCEAATLLGQSPLGIQLENREALVQAVLRYVDGMRETTVPMDIDVPFDASALGLKEIGNLASWTVSSCKPGCGVEALRDDDTGLLWQSDGPQPHHLNIHFSRLVSIRSIRIFLDFEADESYTPTRITLLAGTGYHDLIPFSALEFTQPKGWIDVPLEEVGGGEDGRTLRAFLVQVKVVENHQNGKDTHIRGLKVYAKDERVRAGITEREAMEVLGKSGTKGKGGKERDIFADETGWLVEPDWMGEPELR